MSDCVWNISCRSLIFHEQELSLSMLKKNARFERMVAQGFRPGHGIWIDTYNRQFGGGIIYTILAGVSNRNHYYVAVEL